ncbi:MAG TPA: Ig-like domain-containing protein [Tepidisphaeraceae bacterium]|jgi:glucose/arabinose dehydrogenase
MFKLIRRDRSRRDAALSVAVETLEKRQLLSVASHAIDAPNSFAGNVFTQIQEYSLKANAMSVAAAQPTIRSSTPANGGTINRDGFLSASVNLVTAGAGVDASTLSTDTVRLYRTSDNQFVNSISTTTGGGDGIVTRPAATLAANTSYTWEITSGVKDTAGNSFVPYTITFTTNNKVQSADPYVRFDHVNLPAAQNKQFAGLAIGPDGKLYAGVQDGTIIRYDIQGDGQLANPQTISTVADNNGGARWMIGLEFDPASTANNLILWVSHSQAIDNGQTATDWTGKISKLTGANLGIYQDVIVGMPRSVRDHLNNQIHFGPDGALYMNQGAMNSLGAPDPAWARAEHLMTAAMWRMDVNNISGTLNVTTSEGGGTYNPYASGAPVTLYATGIRNGFDFTFHPNGHIYVGSNGSFAGGSTPAGPGNNPPAITNAPFTENDYVFDVVKGGYYGHPNPLRSEYVLNGGNPTSGVDYEEVTQYPVGTNPQSNFKRAASVLGQDYAPTGMLTYQSNSFGGRLKNKVLMARYSGGSDIVYLVPSTDGSKLTLVNATGMDGLAGPVDVVEDPKTGNLYVSQYADASKGGMNILLLKVHELPAVTAVRLVNADTGANLGLFRSKSTLNLPDLGRFSVRADTANAVGSVIFNIDGQNIQTENTWPFAIQGNTPSGGYNPWTPTVGTHTLTITPYEGGNGSGVAGAPVTLSFTVTNMKLFKLNVNFQPGNSTFTYPKFRTDIGYSFSKKSSGYKYGWSSDISKNMFNRNSAISPDERFDTGAVMNGAAWQVSVPNGKYAVWMAAGDPTSTSGNYGIAVEGVTVVKGRPTTKKRWLSGSATVTVKDGKLTVAPLAGSSGNKLNLIQITQVG